ncbi:normocyte-binding protein [Clostridium botulinum]|uniref:normocyte-binding protein n=1 Tax=unclassified Clostridium TaxID=2614128 RepID=UPI0013F0B300|nr:MULTISPECIES: normocyte-binding protein [unclassified Clostridium]MBN1054650.1 normocyte-binding protein [Clostridium botulinum]NFS27591.1 normocyte-binding protein [Clostridium botulinum]NFS52400.1 normocyte-binding protein [Clostridium botulinum]NFT17631.1 normocyte-binding protein [Clostridium botulinum]
MNLKEVNLREIYKKWKNDLGEFRCFFRSTSFVSLQTYENFILDDYKNESKKEIITKIINEYNDEDFIIVDLPLDEILDLSLELNNNYFIKPILNINLLFHPFGIVGSRKNISKLVNTGIKLNEVKSKKYIMLIPYDRYNEELDVKKIYDKLNNQYAVADDDLPSADILKRLGYNRIVVFTKDNVKEDLMNYIDYFKNEINVKIVRMEK